ncbi:uncharacterized protein LOC105258323 isoform X2 [Camponotus floridanus]|uniref:uncharacterized protein LOC105258323 isoform X2 n=1 Tax=Camponotus floridanus TaxID=104421 RepID=UPI000DC6A16C|nr:uncharacterized protein LOC105258323 isoform X2 [Camponotus floridanus]
MRAGEMRKRDGEEERVKQDDRSEDLYLSDSSYMRTTDPKIATTHAGNLFGGNLRASFRVRPMDSGEVTTTRIFAICMRHSSTVNVGRHELS